MITATDISDLMYALCKKSFGIDTYHSLNIPKGEVKKDRVTIIVKGNTSGKIWKSRFVEVNISVPDKMGTANLDVLQMYERKATEVFDDFTGRFDGSVYQVTLDNTEIEEDKEFRCHYVNARVLFKVLNTK